ncbi:MAG: LamG domain-containing protein [Erythrobacter sp.]|jgi:hypothetical protein|nr:LamG domain-containing protein [Erythrobacter sp.]
MRAFLFSLMIIVTVASFAVEGVALPKKVLHFNFDGNNAKDLSGNGNDGKINGGAKVSRGALEFDGKDDYVGSSALKVRTTDKSFTAIGWFKTSEAENGPLWMWGDNANPSASGAAEAPVGWRSSTKKFSAGFYIGGHKYADADKDYADGNWHFVAQVGDKDTGYLYIDGKQISSAVAGYIYASNPYFLIGARTKNSGSEIDNVEYFKGFIDEIVVFDAALSKKEIQDVVAQWNAIYPSGKLATTWAGLKK